MKLRLVFFVVLSAVFIESARAAPWSGILSASRAIDWSTAGLPAVFADGETTPNPWTPPTRTQCGPTVAAGASAAAINAALAACSPGHYVLLSPGTYTITSNILMYGHDYVTLRGSGASQTILNFTGTNTKFQFGTCCMGVGSGALSATSYAPGTTSLTITGVADASNLKAGNVAWIQQCDTGWTGTGVNAAYSFPNCTSGSYVDPGGLWVCGIDYPQCTNDTAQSGSHNFQKQNVLITSVTNNGGGSYTVTFTPGLYMANWSSNNNAQMIWQQSSAWSYGMGLEDMTINLSFNANEGIDFQETYGSWVKGNRILGYPTYTNISIGPSAHGLIANNYIFGENANQLSSNISEPVLRSGDSDNLLLNNIITGGICTWANGGNTGDVIAYQYCRDTQTLYYSGVTLNHLPYESFLLTEGNQHGQSQDDDTHGTHDLNTWFRNDYSGWDPPYVTLNPRSFELDNFHRFDNFIGNVLGGAQSTAYQGTSSSVGNIYVIPSRDPLGLSSFMRWGNCDTINGNCRFVSSEVPADLSAWPNSVAFQNPVPSDTKLPASFFMSGLTAHLNGGTGLSWWQVCTGWSAFPTSCASTLVPPFPAAGPELNGGAYVNGHGYDTPAALAYKYLPIDASLQSSFPITASSWSGGVETLTVDLSAINGGSNMHVMGGFQLSGVNSACLPADLPPNGEILMTGSTLTSISYALPSNPNTSCAGTFKFPDVRQFDERVYQADSSGGGDTIPPMVAVSSPANGATVSGSITILGTAADNIAVSSVALSIDGGAYSPASGITSWSFALNTTGLSNAAHTITAKATDSSGNIATASISVTVNNGGGGDIAPPTVAISSPTDNAVVSGNVTLSANASDNVGVASVQFLVDGTNFGSPVTAPPYSVVWNVQSLRNNSRHTIAAIATDAAGNAAAAASVGVTVNKRLATNADVPGLRDAFVYPNPAVRQSPVIRAMLGMVDSVDVTVFDMAGHAVNSGSLDGAPSGITADGEYYYDYVWPGAQASGIYVAAIRGKKADGTTVRARVKFAVVR